MAGAKFCANCGTPLTTPTPAQPQPVPSATLASARSYPPSYTPATPYAFDLMDYERRKKVGRTRNGLLLLVIGTILAALPVIAILGGILVLIGAILVILGREVFGKTHSRNTIWSVGIYVLGLVVIAIFSAGFILAIVSASLTASNPTVLARTLTDNFNNFLIGLIIGSAIIGIAEVRFTYALQTPTGRILLWAAYATSLAVGIALLAIIGPQVSEVVAQAISSGTFNRAPIDRLQSQLQGIQLLGLIPAAIYAFAYYLAWSRVKTGEIPKTNSRHTCRATGALAVSLSNPTLHKTVPADESRLEQLRIGKHGLKRARFTTLSPRF